MPDATLHQVVTDFLPTTPVFDLVQEPWVPVTDSTGATETVGLRDLLLQSHDMDLNPAQYGPLWRHAVHRLLIGLTYLIHAHQPNHEWTSVAAGTAPLPPDAVDAVLTHLQDHLWLHHPATPFLQSPQVLAHMKLKQPARRDSRVDTLVKNTDPYWSLLPDVPSKSNTAWFGRASERDNPTAADVANALLMRHWFAVPGNEARNTLAEGGRSEGGATGLSHHGRSVVTVAGPTLAATLTRNLLDDWLEAIPVQAPSYIDQPAAGARSLADNAVLWFYTASCVATVVIPAQMAPDGYRVVRTPAPMPKSLAKTVASHMAAHDPHGLRVDPKSTGPPHSHVKLSSSGSDLDLVRRMYTDLERSGLHRPTVLGRRDLRYQKRPGKDVEVLVVDGAGSSTGPRIAGTALFHPPTGVLDVDPSRRSWFLEQANRLVGGKGAVATRVGSAVLVVRGTGRDLSQHQVSAVYDECRRNLTQTLEPILRSLLAHAISDPKDPKPLPTGLSEDQRGEVRRSALSLFDRLVEPYRTRPTAVAHIVRQRQRLRWNLTRDLELT